MCSIDGTSRSYASYIRPPSKPNPPSSQEKGMKSNEDRSLIRRHMQRPHGWLDLRRRNRYAIDLYG